MSADVSLPLNPIPPGSMVYVEGRPSEVATELAITLTMQASDARNGLLYATTDTPSWRVLTRLEGFRPDSDPAGVKVIDCTERGDERATRASEVQIETVSDLRDPTGLGIKFSILHEHLCQADYSPVLAGVISATTLVEEAEEFREVVRLLNMIGRRIESAQGLAVVAFDSQRLDEETHTVLRQVCDGGIEVRTSGEDHVEFSTIDLPHQPDGWTQFHRPD